MIHGIGVDLLHLSRFRGLIQRRGLNRVARRILSKPEETGFHSVVSGADSDDAVRYLATR
jgi:phosphopantetheinyl transferase (holo-ACP synthase)